MESYFSQNSQFSNIQIPGNFGVFASVCIFFYYSGWRWSEQFNTKQWGQKEKCFCLPIMLQSLSFQTYASQTRKVSRGQKHQLQTMRPSLQPKMEIRATYRQRTCRPILRMQRMWKTVPMASKFIGPYQFESCAWNSISLQKLSLDILEKEGIYFASPRKA